MGISEDACCFKGMKLVSQCSGKESRSKTVSGLSERFLVCEIGPDKPCPSNSVITEHSSN